MIGVLAMRMDQLTHIVEVSKTKSINKAAQNCFISHQNICNTIRVAEQKFGIVLFDRSPGGATLTTAGEKFVELAQEILDRVNEMEELKQEFAAADLKSLVKFYHIHSLNSSVHSEILANFCTKYPNIKITVEEKTTPEVLQLVADTPDALGYLALPKKLYNQDSYLEQGVRVCFLYHEKFKICVGANYQLDRKIVSIHEMLKHPWVIFEYTPDMTTATLLEDFGKPEVFMQTNSPELFRKLIRDGSAIGMVVDSTSRNKQFVDDNIRFIPLRESADELGFLLHLVSSARCSLSPAAELLVETLLKKLPQSMQGRINYMAALDTTLQGE